MVQRVEAEDSLLLMSTYRYLHPELKPLLARHAEGALLRRDALRLLGPHLDIYALGIISLEMLTGKPDLPRPLSKDAMSSLLRHANPFLTYVDQPLLDRLSQLIVRMVGVDVSTFADARHVHSECRDLLSVFNKVSAPRAEATVTSVAQHAGETTPSDGVAVGIAHAVESLQSIAESLETATTLMLRSVRRLEPLEANEKDTEVLGEMNAAFRNALSRTKAAWRIGIWVSVVCFLLIIGMIASTVVLAVATGKPAWSLVFGGASVTLVIGTLLWRPYDRAFRATILAQQLEMIHVQSTASFRSTKDLERRIEICREAMAALQNLLEQHFKEASGQSAADVESKTSPTNGST